MGDWVDSVSTTKFGTHFSLTGSGNATPDLLILRSMPYLFGQLF